MSGTKKPDGIAQLEMIERFWEDPEGEGMIPLEMLAERGVEMPHPSELDEEALHERLWQAIEMMGTIGMYLESTDHLSDRQLYEYLLEQLRQPEMLFPDDPRSATTLSPIGGGGEPEIWLRYYADDEDRKYWMEDFPDFDMPHKEDPPFQRDHLLPSQMERMSGREQ